MGARFACIRLRAKDGALGERAAAEAFAAGACGIEERAVEQDADGIELLVYAPFPLGRAVAEALAELARGERGCFELSEAQPAPDVDWSVRWRDGLGVVRISPRLAVRPPFVADDAGGAALVIDPGQAFGTGGHASTRLALALLDALPETALLDARVLDAGTGSGVLALAALALGAREAVAFDLDASAVREAAANATRNGLAPRVRLFTGPIAALRTPPFDLALANLLRSELLPILPDLTARLRSGGRAVLSGLLASERGPVEAALGEVGLSMVEARTERDATGDVWLGLVTRR